MKNIYSTRTTLLSTIALAVNPVFFEFSHKIFTEIPALALLLLAIVVLGNPKEASDKRWFLSCVAFGLMLGIRLSWWPFALFYFIKGYRSDKGIYSSSGFLAGILLWLVPQAIIVGPKELISIGISFTTGHFSTWGGAMGSELGTNHRFSLLTERLGEIVGWSSSGSIWTRVPWIIFALSGIFMTLKKTYTNNESVRIFLLAALLYMSWVIVGQNPENVRHLIPLIPVIILAVSPLVEKFPQLATVIILIFSLTLPIDYAGRTQKSPPPVQLRDWTNSLNNSNVDFYCGNSERLFDLYPSKQRVVNVASINNLSFAVKSSWMEPSRKLICDDIPGFKPSGKPIAVFPAREGDPVDRTLRLYNLKIHEQS